MTLHPPSQSFETALAAPAREEHVAFEIVRTTEALSGLEADWNDLFRRAGRGTQVFQTFAWVWHWARAYVPAIEQAQAGLAVLVARRGGRLCLVWPLVLQAGAGGRTLRSAGCPVSQYGDAIVDGASAGERLALIEAGLAALIEEFAPDLIVLDRVREDAELAPLVTQRGGVAYGHAEAPWLPLAAGCGTSFEERQKGAAKKNRRRLMRRLERGGEVRWSAHQGTPEAVEAARVALAMKRDWLARNGIVSRAFSDRLIDEFFQGAVGDARRGAGTMAFTLTREGQPVALAIGIGCKGRLTLHVIVHDPAYDDCGAGLLNIEACLRHAEREGFEAFDLLPPQAEYKAKWAADTVAVADHAIGLTLRGRLTARVWHGLLRDLLKRISGKLPASLRRRALECFRCW